MPKFFDQYVKTVVLVENIRTIKTRGGKDMAFITASDETTSTEFIVFSDMFSRMANVKRGDLIYVSGRIERRFDKYQIVVKNLQKI